jgi:hypothetical protein
MSTKTSFVTRKKKFSRCQICQLRTSNPHFLLRHLKTAHNQDLYASEAATDSKVAQKNPTPAKAFRVSKAQSVRVAKKAPFVLPSYVRKALVERKFNANPAAPGSRFQCSVCRDEFESDDILVAHVAKVHKVRRNKSRISKLAAALKSGILSGLARKLF